MNSSKELLDQGIITVPLDSILEYWDPMLDNAWGCGVIDAADVLLRVNRANTCARSAEFGSPELTSYEFNTARIAYLVYHGWETADVDSSPITIDIGMSGYTPPELVVDGNHRLAAAKVRGDKELQVSIIGDVDKALAVFCNAVHIDDY